MGEIILCLSSGKPVFVASYKINCTCSECSNIVRFFVLFASKSVEKYKKWLPCTYW